MKTLLNVEYSIDEINKLKDDRDELKSQVERLNNQMSRMREACANYPGMVDQALAQRDYLNVLCDKLVLALSDAQKRLDKIGGQGFEGAANDAIITQVLTEYKNFKNNKQNLS